LGLLRHKQRGRRRRKGAEWEEGGGGVGGGRGRGNIPRKETPSAREIGLKGRRERWHHMKTESRKMQDCGRAGGGW